MSALLFPATDLLDELRGIFPFELDEFQIRAIQILAAGESVVVCAPTGSGKTLIGEYAIYRALAHGKRVFYTTPLKALSNQKFRDFGQQFGPERVGLLTGDISINREAPILVMTTEIFRNMLYGTPVSLAVCAAGSLARMADEEVAEAMLGDPLQDVQAVILDECHYMNDQQRGTVWEESIIYCPSTIQLIALSATIANSDQLTDWMNHVHGPTHLIDSDHRPVPLQFHFANHKGLFPLLEQTESGQWIRNRRLRGKRPNPHEHSRAGVPDMTQVLENLRQRDMLPAIYFIFSRKGCDAAVASVGALDLIATPEERQRLAQQIDQFCQETPEAVRQDHLSALYRGIAAHHAGMLPAWKGLVEHLFQQGLVKIVFATETLAAGINMPARTTVISSLSKRTDTGHRLLTASEFMQMSGRAGRRGKDVIGHVVTVQSPFEGAQEAARLATSGADPLVSQFTPTYGMVVNLLQKHSLEAARDLINRSFGQYLLSLQKLPEQHELQHTRAELEELDRTLGDISSEDVTRYEKMQAQRREERRLLRYLVKQREAEPDPTLRLLAFPHIQAQEEKIRALETQIRANPAHKVGKKLLSLQEKRQRLLKRLEHLERQSDSVQELRWQQFMALVQVLQDFDCLENSGDPHEGHQPTASGEVVAALRGDNELWLALALLSGECQGCDPHHLAGVVAALVTEPPRSGTYSRLRTSGLVEDVLHGLRGLRRQLFRSQRQHQVFHMPIWFEPGLAGIVEHWAQGIPWETLEANTNLDAGDLVRLIRRTLDLLSQIPHVPHLPQDLRENARQAQNMLDRFPISELI
ncbi:MAG: DEAD/DEAH box helicase [Thermostichus sp. DRC_bins_24]